MKENPPNNLKPDDNETSFLESSLDIPLEIEEVLSEMAGGDLEKLRTMRESYLTDPIFKRWVNDPYGFSLTSASPDFSKTQKTDTELDQLVESIEEENLP